MTHRLAVANHKRHRLAAKARDALREHGLVGERRDHSVAVRARHIRGREDGDDPGMSAFERLDVAENKCGVRVRRAHRARGQGLCRPFVGAEDFCAGELADAVEAGNATPDRGLRRQFRDISGIEQARVLHRVEDRAIARAAAQYACERVLDRLFVGTRLSPQERDGGEQNARGADAALRGAMGVKGGAKLRDNDLAVAQALDGFDRAPVRLPDRGQAGADRLAVDEHCAGAAIAGVAADLDARQAALLAQRMTEAIERRTENSAPARR